MSSLYRNSSVRNSRARLAVRLACAAAAACATPAAFADIDWVFDPRIEAGAVYNDNYRLTDQRGQEIEVKGGDIDAALGIRGADQRSQYALTPRIRSTFFPDASSEEATDYYLGGSAENRTQRFLSKLQAQFADESVVSSELLAADFPGLGLGQTVSGDTGLVTVRNRRRLITVNPDFSYDWTTRRHVVFGVAYVDVKYQDQVAQQVGFKDYDGYAGLLWDVSQRHTFSVRVTGDRFTPDDNTQDINTGGVVAEWRTAASAITSYYFRLGVNHSDRNATDTQPGLSSTNLNGGLGAEWHFQATQLVLDAMQTTAPSGSGTVVERDEVRFRLVRTFQPRLSGFVALRGIRTNGLGNEVVSVRDRKYAAGSTGFEWRANRQFSLHGEYDYTWQKFADQPNDASSNGVIVSVIYEPRRLNN